MDLSLYFSPYKLENTAERVFSPSFGHFITTYKKVGNFPSLDGADVVLLGVPEYRGFVDSSLSEQETLGSAQNIADNIRKHFYSFFPDNFNKKIIDLGNLKLGATLNDTYAAVSLIVEYLLSKNVVIVFFSGTQDLSFPIYKSFVNLRRLINISTIDNKLDIGNMDLEISSNNYMSKIIIESPNFLFNYINIGYQTYLLEQEARELMDKMFFEAYRFGEFRYDAIKKAEALVRSADFLSVDMAAVRASDSPASLAMPTGFSSEEICQIMRYSGMSAQTSILGLFNAFAHLDTSERSAMLMAEMLWCFIDGLSTRINDNPYFGLENNIDYKQYMVSMEDYDHDICFYKALQTDRWWMALPCEKDDEIKYGRHRFVACLYDDYLMAMEGEVPMVYLRAIERF